MCTLKIDILNMFFNAHVMNLFCLIPQIPKWCNFRANIFFEPSNSKEI